MEGPPNLLVHRSDGRFRISAYNVDLPSHFRAIKAELAADLNADNVTYLATEHIGSTSVPDLRAKVIIDILLVIAADEFHEAKRQQILEALSGKKSGQGAYHNNNGDGGVKGRWTLKLNGIWPYRSLYVVAHGSIPHRNPIALRDTLRKDEGLRNEYERIKRDLAKRTKHLERAGWTNEEVDEMEEQCRKHEPVLPEVSVLSTEDGDLVDVDEKEGCFWDSVPTSAEVAVTGLAE